ncbi:MAG: arginine--tRNA ligase [Planctomycetes bacterium]|nr:arginine--tRNA ligase [Planctomycetota bacterium]
MHPLSRIQQRFRDALQGMAADVEPYVAMVKPAQDARHGDYQANCAMSLAKTLGKKPRDIAQQIVGKLDLGDLLQAPEIAGPGFINLRLRDDWIAARLRDMAADERLGVAAAQAPRTIVIDFSSPNVAKPMHVGHLRSTIIGDALARLFRFLGHRVIADNHLGDWGTQFGMLLHAFKNFRDEQALKSDPVREMLRLYLKVRELMRAAEVDEDDAGPSARTYSADEIAQARQVADAARTETARLHAGDAENVALWEQFMPWCLEEIDRIYRRLDVRFDHTHGESFYNPMLDGVVRDLLDKKIAEESQGAIAIFLDPERKQPPALVRKKDGAFTYTTSDLATIRYRADTWQPDAMLYVVDARQALHFKNLFTAARKWGYDKVALEHVSFGSVLGEDRKPLKTREGGAVELGSLIEEAVARAGQMYEQIRAERIERGDEVPELTAEERKQIEEAVGIGAVKYADLCQNRATDYVFSWSKMLAMTGNTATYMQYAYARNRSIFRKGDVDVSRFRASPPPVVVAHPAERALAMELLRLEETLHSAAAEYQPSDITNYLWNLSKSYSSFFDKCPVLKADTPELRDSRLLLCDLTARTIQQCLGLLGIRTIEMM